MKVDLVDIAYRAMREKNFVPDFSSQIREELLAIPSTFSVEDASLKDMRDKQWISIDNDDSLDLDQLTFAEVKSQKSTIYIAVADVATLVRPSSAIDGRAHHNTTSIYTPMKVFSMLPEKLSTNLTSLNENEDRRASVVEITIQADGALDTFNVYRAIVRNHRKLAYNAVGNWIEKKYNAPSILAPSPELGEQILLQDSIAQKMKQYRHSRGMLSFEKIEAKPVVSGGLVVDLIMTRRNRAHELIEYFMIAANTAMTLFFKQKQLPIFRRIVRIPKRWERIVEIANDLGTKLPSEPDSKALEQFLVIQKKENPQQFSDLSLAIIKLIGRGEYTIQLPHDTPIVHFGLALKEYSHTTAPNRRYPDLITQRLLFAALAGQQMPYSIQQLETLANHCTLKEADAEKVQRRVEKSAAALFLSPRINEVFEGIVTGASEKGTWVRLLSLPVEGKLVNGSYGVDVGDRVTVRLVSVDVDNGFIDFSRESKK